MKLKIFLIVFLLLILFLIIYLIIFFNKNGNNIKSVKINNIEINVETASSYYLQLKGLSGKKSLEDNQGMIFIYPDYQIRNFWMKDMNFPIDVLWIKDDTITGLQKNIQIFDKNGKVSKFISPNPTNYVLELSAGFINKNNIKVGDKIKLIYEK